MEFFQIKPDIYFGSGSLDILRKLEISKVFLVTDENMVKLKITDRITNILKSGNIDVKIFSNINPDPTDEEIIVGMMEMVEYSPDCIIALGGGSPIDACKAMIYFIKKIEKAMGRQEKHIFIAIPTTSGTGSEVTTYSVITSGKRKIPLSEEEMLPDIAILNPDFIKTLPPKVIADTGMDVLTHAIEAYVCKKTNLFIKTLAIGAIKTVFSDLVNNYENPELERERTDLQIASCMAGIAFSNASLGVNHSIAHALGARFHIAHGRLNAMLMPKVILFNSKNKRAAELYSEIARELGFIPRNAKEGAELLAKAIEIRNFKMKIPGRLKDMGVSEKEYFKQINSMILQIEEDKCTEHNPRRFTRIEMAEFLRSIY